MTPDPEVGQGPVDEFDWIARCLAPLAAGAPGALGLLDDAAVVTPRPGYDLVLSKDALVEGVHFLSADPMDEVARKLLRVNLSDLAAKGAEPFGYMLAVAWPAERGWDQRAAFARGLGEDQIVFGLSLLGGDTVSTPGPVTASLTILGWAPHGRMVRRSTARPGDILLVSGTIGDGTLGLDAARGIASDLTGPEIAWLATRYRRPEPRLALIEGLREHASAAADVSDGLVADAGRIATASKVALSLDLDQLPLSQAAAHWLATQPDQRVARLALATGGDDYEIVCTAAPEQVKPLIEAAAAAGLDLTPIGRVEAGQGVVVFEAAGLVTVDRAGYRHP